jgi:hypothetical protein
MKRCLICKDWTAGSLSVNNNFCAAICPECRAVEDKAADMAAQDVAATIDIAMTPTQELETIA